MRHIVVVSVIAAAVVAALAIPFAAAGPTPTCTTDCITEFPVQPTGGGPFGITAGPGQTIWYGHINTVGRLAADGTTEAEFSVPTPNPFIGWVTRGTGHTIWFAERWGNKIGRIDEDGNVVEYSIPTAVPCSVGLPSPPGLTSFPQGIAIGRDRGVWFTEECGNKIGRLDPGDGTISEFDLPLPASHPLGIIAGPDGALWFTQRFSAIGRITTDGEITEFPLETFANPQRITAGHDNALWFTELGASKIGRITTDGELSEYPVADGAGPGITSGPDDAIWFTDAPDRVVRMDLSGTVTNTYAVPPPAGGASQITSGPHRTLWFAETRGNKLGRLQPFLTDDDAQSGGRSLLTFMIGRGRR
jgi:virginiamycin B lyase